MAAAAVGRVALMSIHPAYADAIFDGTKRVEFRKRPLADDVTHVVVYVTAPVSSVVGSFAVTRQDVAHPRVLWDRYQSVAGIEREPFFQYFAGRRYGTGIGIGELLALPERWSLPNRLGIPRPPQSFQYLAADAAELVLTHATGAKEPVGRGSIAGPWSRHDANAAARKLFGRPRARQTCLDARRPSPLRGHLSPDDRHCPESLDGPVRTRAYR